MGGHMEAGPPAPPLTPSAPPCSSGGPAGRLGPHTRTFILASAASPSPLAAQSRVKPHLETNTVI